MAKSSSTNTVLIGCRLPNGLVIEHPSDSNNKIELNGKNKIIIVGAEYGLTMVDREFATAWFAANKDFAPVKSFAIFMAETNDDAMAIGKDLSNELTGFEGMRTDGKDARAAGVKQRTEE